MKAEEICVPENKGKEYYHMHGLDYAVIDEYGAAHWRTPDGDMVPLTPRYLDGWKPREPDPPQPTQRIEEWAVKPCDGRLEVYDLKGKWQGSLDKVNSKPRWLRYYIIILPNGMRVESTHEALWWDTDTKTCAYRSPASGKFRPGRDKLILPDAVPMLIEEEA